MKESNVTVKLSESPMPIEVFENIDCSGPACEEKFFSQLSLDLTGAASDTGLSLISASNSRYIRGLGRFGGSALNFTVIRSMYNIRAAEDFSGTNQNPPALYLRFLVDCTGATCTIGSSFSSVEVDLLGLPHRQIYVTLEGSEMSTRVIWEQGNTFRNYTVISQPNVTVRLQEGSLDAVFPNIDCSGRVCIHPGGGFTSILSLDLTGAASDAGVSLLSASNSRVIRGLGRFGGSALNFTVIRSMYDIIVAEDYSGTNQSPSTLYLRFLVDCTGATCTIGSSFSSVEVDLLGMSHRKIDVTLEGSEMSTRVIKEQGNTFRNYTVISQPSVTVRLREGSMADAVFPNIDCSGPVCVHPYGNFASVLSMDLTGAASDATIGLYSFGFARNLVGGLGSLASFPVIRSTYAISLVEDLIGNQYNANLVVANIDCTGLNCYAGSFSSVEFDFTNMPQYSITVTLQGDQMLHQDRIVENQGNELRNLTVVSQPNVTVRLQEGPMTEAVFTDIDCSTPSCNVGAGFASELVVDMSDLPTGVSVRLLDATNGNLIRSTGLDQGGSIRTYSVIRSVYNVVVTDGSQSFTASSLDCTGASCETGPVTLS